MDILKKILEVDFLKDSYPYSHVAFPVFLLNKKRVNFEEYKEKIENKKEIKKIWLENNFVNIIFSPEIIKRIEEVTNKNYNGKNKEDHKTVLIEHTSNNPTGPLHIGRVRSTFIGDFLANAYEYLGFKVRRHFYVNDLGKQIALIYLAKKFGIKKDNFVLNEYSKKYMDREDYITLLYYVAANERYKEDQKFKEEVDNFLKKAEEDLELRKKLKETAEFALKGIKTTFSRLNIHFDSFDYESDFLEDTKKYLKLISNKLNIKEHPYIVKIKVNNKEEEVYLTRKDGTTTYLSRDIAYHKYKEKLADLLINVLGEDHKREFLLLKELLSIVGFSKELEGVFFSFLTLNGSKLSTRKGNIITVDELIDLGKGVMEGDEDQKEKLAIASLKVEILKNNINKPIDFRWELASKTEGETGVYLIYTYARINSIINKSQNSGHNININNFEDEMVTLYLQNYLFDHYLRESVKKRNPAIFLHYLFNLAKIFNKYYSKNKIIGSKNENEKIFILKKLQKSFKNAFKILNIPYLEKIEK